MFDFIKDNLGIVGGIAGGLIGGPGGAITGYQLGSAASKFGGGGGGGGGAPPVYKIDTGKFNLNKVKPSNVELAKQNQDEEFRKRQLAFIQQMQDQAAGKGAPSIAEMQLKQGSEQNIAGLQAALAGNRSVNPALASRLVANQYAQEQNRVNQEAAMLRANEQLQAQQLLGQNLSQGRSQDLEAAKLAQYYSSLGFDQAKAQLLANMELEKLKQEEYGRAQGLQFQKSQASDARFDKYLGAGLKAGGDVLASLIKTA